LFNFKEFLTETESVDLSWFGDSKVVDRNGLPLKVFHGTGSLKNLDEFKQEFTGQGNDQLGGGFYFTDRLDTAFGYTNSISRHSAPELGKIGGNDSPGVITAYLKIENPFFLYGENIQDIQEKDFLTFKEAIAIIEQSKILYDIDETPIGNWIDIWSEGEITKDMVYEVAQYYTGSSIISLENDFFSYKGGSEDFRKAVYQATGKDGIIQHYDQETHFVAWFPHQIRIIERTPN
jgi:hypothetical protein